ncbi:MAG: fumarylacetoacetate hydrolase family protein [Candidatus Eiseniibacteriota bacterium]
MILATFAGADGKALVGAVDAARATVLDLAAAARRAGRDAAPFASMLALIDGGDRALDGARALAERHAGDRDLMRPLAEIRLLSPVPEPRQVRDFSVFPGHIRQAPVGMRRLATRVLGEAAALAAFGPEHRELPPVPPIYASQPLYYKANRFSVIGTDQDVHWPRYSEYMDYELEFGIFIGKTALDVPAAKAREHIFGFAIFNDFSARDAQMREMAGRLGPAKGKDFNGGNSIGPWIATRDEILDPYRLKMAARVNGETRSEGDSSAMLHSFEDMIAHVSRDETVYAGEFFGSGTMGNGCGLEQDRYLGDGDVVELEVERIGILRNRVLRQAPSSGAA